MSPEILKGSGTPLHWRRAGLRYTRDTTYTRASEAVARVGDLHRHGYMAFKKCFHLSMGVGRIVWVVYKRGR